MALNSELSLNSLKTSFLLTSTERLDSSPNLLKLLFKAQLIAGIFMNYINFLFLKITH